MPKFFKSLNPYTQEIVGEYMEASAIQIEVKLEWAQMAQREWATRSFAERGLCFEQLAQYLREQKAELALQICQEMGKILPEALAEIEKCAAQCSYYAQHAATLLQAESIPTEARQSGITYEPVGIVLAIMPWNFPYWQVFRYAVPALMAGNVTLLKHAPNVFGCALSIEAAFQAAGFPAGVFQTLIADIDAAQRLVADERIGMLTLTGSERAGAAMAALAGGHIKKTVLELGGNDALIVLPDADLDKAAAAAVQSRMMNAGQVCIAAKRFLVHQDIKAPFTDKVLQLIRNLKQGDPLDPQTQLGPLARLDLAETLERQLQQALAQGASLLCGGKRQDCNFEPTLLDEVQPDSIVFREETFGPLAALTTVSSAEEAVHLANQSRYGLSATIWTQDLDKAKVLAQQLQVGSVFINAVVRSDSRLPIGGVKKSGYGRELAAAGIKEFCVLKTHYIA
jgi:succinate-semialdehyde dehydrogenase/glutarate-semialdehyde dehydrogenase